MSVTKSICPGARERTPSSTLYLAALLTLASCISSAPPKPKSPEYQPSFQYSVTDTGKKIDVTVGIVAPQYSGDGQEYWSRNKTDDAGRSLARGIRTSFAELFVAKGFNAAGPFDDVEGMTYPEKKGCDFVIYPDFDIDIRMIQTGGTTPSVQPERKKASFSLGDLGTRPANLGCSAKLTAVGTIQLVVKEPLSGERMWIKKIDVSQPSKDFNYEGAECELENGSLHGARADWARTHETMFQTVMSSLDRYVTPEDFVTLKEKSQTLREKKAY